MDNGHVMRAFFKKSQIIDRYWPMGRTNCRVFPVDLLSYVLSLSVPSPFFLQKLRFQKSDNLQYNTLVRWADGTNDSSTKHLTLQVFFFIISYRLRALKTLYFHFCNFIKKLKNKLKGFLQRILQDFMKKK